MNKGIVLSLYDFTGEALKPWAEAGYTCHAFDIQHEGTQPTFENTQFFAGGGSITYRHADLYDQKTLNDIQAEFGQKPVVFGMAFCVCTDMAVSGAAWFASKAEKNPFFQAEAVGHVTAVSRMFNGMGFPYMIENPVSVLATKWRKPDYNFHPYEYGGYIADDQADHPRWPEYIAPRDAYPKKTCLWTGGGFTMPEKKVVDAPAGYSTQHKKLGGKSQRTKDIRSATPRGFARAVFEANA